MFCMGPRYGPLSDSDGVCSIGPSLAYGIQLVCIEVQIRGPCQGPMVWIVDAGFLPAASYMSMLRGLQESGVVGLGMSGVTSFLLVPKHGLLNILYYTRLYYTIL